MAADFCITKVRYDVDQNRIELVQVRKELVSERKLGPVREVPRAFVAVLIRLNKATFLTRMWNQQVRKWIEGAPVHVVDNEFITTDKKKHVSATTWKTCLNSKGENRDAVLFFVLAMFARCASTALSGQ